MSFQNSRSPVITTSTGDVAGSRLRDVTTTETPIRTRLRLRGGRASVPRALAIIDNYIAGKMEKYAATPVTTSNGAQIVRKPEFAATRFASRESIFASLSEGRVPEEHGGQRFTTTISVTPNGIVDFQLEVARRTSGSRPSLATPRVVRELAQDPNVGLVEIEDGTEIVVGPRFADPGDQWLARALFAPGRSLAIIACGFPLAISDDVVNALALRTCGLAHVVAIRYRELSFDITNLYGKEWSVFQSALRVYGPRLEATDDPRRVSRLFFENVFGAQAPPDALRGVLDELVRLAGAFVQSELFDQPMPSLESAIRTAAGPNGNGLRSVDAPRRFVRDGTPAAESTAPPALRTTRAADPEPSETFAVDATSATSATGSTSETSATTDAIVAERDARIAELREEIDQLRKTNGLLAEEVAFEREVAASWQLTATHGKERIAELLARLEATTMFATLPPQWAKLVQDLIDAGSSAKALETRIDDLEETNAALQAQQTAIEHRLAASPIAEHVPPPAPQDPVSLGTYLAAKYPGVFSIFGQGTRSYKKTDPYVDQARFLMALDVLGTEYYLWKTAAPGDRKDAQARFDRRCEALSLKNTPSASPQGYNVNPEQHTVRLSGGRTALMYELRDNGTTMEERHMLYIGYAWDDQTGQVVIARFDHPDVMSSHT